MPENDTEKNLDEKIEENVHKMFGDSKVTNVVYGHSSEIKETIEKRNEDIIKNAEEHNASVAHISIENVDDLAFPFKEHLVFASDGGVGVIGQIDPSDLVDLLSNITKAVLVCYGVDPDDKAQFNMKAAVVIMLAAVDFMGDSCMPHKIINRFSRLMEAIEELIED